MARLVVIAIANETNSGANCEYKRMVCIEYCTKLYELASYYRASMAGARQSNKESIEQICTDRIRNGCNIELQEKWVNPNLNLQKETLAMFPEACQNHHIFSQHSGLRPKHIVVIRSVYGTPYEHLHDTANLSIYAGGPGCMVGAALDSVISSSRSEKSGITKPSKVMFVTYNFEHSNASSSGYNFHLRCSNALNADPTVRGHRILYQYMRRKFISRDKLLDEALKLPYLKVDLSFKSILSDTNHCLRTVRILSGGLWHTIRNVVVDKVNSMHTDWVRNRSYSQNSVTIFRYLESAASQLGVRSTSEKKPSLLAGTESDSATPKAIFVAFDEEGAKHAEKHNASVLKTNRIKSHALTETELAQVMGGDKGQIYKAYVYPGEGQITADMNLVLRDIVVKSGNGWQEGVVIESVFVDSKGIRGVEFRNTVTGKTWYQPCSSAVLSLGYTCSYKFESPQKNLLGSPVRRTVSSFERKVGILKPAPGTITAAGCSGYFLVKGRIPIIEAHISHWTEVAYSPEKDITLAKLTGGGNIGSECVPATYVLNNLEHLRNLFGDRLIGILSMDSCPRAINSQNDVQFYQVAPGLAISLGLGGTGMTKSGANGALSYLLSHPETKASELIPGVPELFSSVNLQKFVTQRTHFTQRALNLRADYSIGEITGLAGIGVGIFWIATKLYTYSYWSSSSRKRSFGPTYARNPFLSSQRAVNASKSSSTAVVESASPFSSRSRQIHTYTIRLSYILSCNLRLLSFYRYLFRIKL